MAGYIKQSLSLADTDSNIDFTNYFSGINPLIHQHPTNLNIHSNMMGFSIDNLLPQLSESSGYSENFPGLFIHEDNMKKAAMEIDTPASTPANSSDNGIMITKKSGVSRRGKKAKHNETKETKPMDVVHVRAKRGQATDSHSLAERVRREKINERLRCLQDIVPGCYKTMGMSVMLDEIINYVQSLQNQVDFLSMKIAAASMFYDFNSDADDLETMQRAKAIEVLKIQNGVNHGIQSAQFGPLGLNFDYSTQFPYNR